MSKYRCDVGILFRRTRPGPSDAVGSVKCHEGPEGGRWALEGRGEGGGGGVAGSENADLSSQHALGRDWSRRRTFPAGLQLPVILSLSVQIPVLLAPKIPCVSFTALLEQSLAGSFWPLQRMPFPRNGALGPGGQGLGEAPEVRDAGSGVQ